MDLFVQIADNLIFFDQIFFMCLTQPLQFKHLLAKFPELAAGLSLGRGRIAKLIWNMAFVDFVVIQVTE